jgi:acetyl coenzyme A synthetase (ADP forming)-like protein
VAEALRSFFEPSGVVLVGATIDPEKLGRGVAENLAAFPGVVHFVGARRGSLFGRPVYPDVSEVPDPVDLAVVLVPARGVAEVVDACGRRGIRSVIVATSGFRETGAEGAALEAECVEAARRHGIRLLGPNCIGTIDTHVRLNTTFLRPPGPAEGPIGFLGHSGALSAAVIDWAREQGFGFSRIVSLGNQADLTETDLLPSVAADPATRVIALYLEGIGDGFVRTATGIDTPIVALKAGRYASGRRAVASHTAALAGKDGAFDAAFRRAGVLRAESVRELFDWARALAWCPPMRGPNVAILTNAGGPGVIAADAVEEYGMTMATLRDGTTNALREALTASASVANPVDMLASATPSQYRRCLELLLGDESVDAVLVILPPPPRYPAEQVAASLASVRKTKPVVVALMGGEAIREAARRFREAGVPEYLFPREAAGALGALYRYGASRRRDSSVCTTPSGVARVDMGRHEGWLDQFSAFELLSSGGIPVVRTVVVDDIDAARDAAEQIGYPVVLKVDSPHVVHKTEAGGVRLNLPGPAELEAAFRSIVVETGTTRMVAQPMVEPGEEVAVGFVRDPQFGPMVMFGTGGVDVETAGDAAFALVPVTCDDVDHLFSDTRAGRQVVRMFGEEVREALVDVLLRLAEMARRHPEIAEAEVNPFVVHSDAIIGVDGRVLVDRGDRYHASNQREGS